MAYELNKRGLRLERQKPIAVIYEGMHLEEGFRADFIVENLVIIELKSVEHIASLQFTKNNHFLFKPLKSLLSFSATLHLCARLKLNVFLTIKCDRITYIKLVFWL